MSLKRKPRNLVIISRTKDARLAKLHKRLPPMAAEMVGALLPASHPKQVEIRRGIRQALKQTGQDVQADNQQYGVPVTSLEDGQIVKIYPDGRREILKTQIPPPVRINCLSFSLE